MCCLQANPVRSCFLGLVKVFVVLWAVAGRGVGDARCCWLVAAGFELLVSLSFLFLRGRDGRVLMVYICRSAVFFP